MMVFIWDDANVSVFVENGCDGMGCDWIGFCLQFLLRSRERVSIEHNYEYIVIVTHCVWLFVLLCRVVVRKSEKMAAVAAGGKACVIPCILRWRAALLFFCCVRNFLKIRI